MPQPYQGQQRRYISIAYSTSNGSPTLAREQLKAKINPPPSRETIRKYWKEEGYRLNKNIGGSRFGANDKRYINKEKLELIIDRIPIYGSLNGAIRALKHSPKVIKEKLTQLGLLQQVLDLEAKIKNQ